jgi:flagellar motor switch protein FliN/FliY
MADEPGKNLDESGQASQDEIDALLNAAADVAGDAAPDATDAAIPDAAGGAETTPPEEAPAADASAVPPEAGLSQADIDAAIAEGGEEDSGLVSQSEIDAVIASSDAPAAEETRLDSEGRPFDAAAAAMAAAIEEEKVAADDGGEGDLPLESMDMPDFTGAAEDDTAALQSIDLLHDVDLRVRIELGRTRMYVEDVLRLGEGSVVELDKLAGDPVDVFVNERLVARGEVLVLNDNFCVRVSEIIADENERIIA